MIFPMNGDTRRKIVQLSQCLIMQIRKVIRGTRGELPLDLESVSRAFLRRQIPRRKLSIDEHDEAKIFRENIFNDEFLYNRVTTSVSFILPDANVTIES